ncbi:sugar ABC transporter substrate-binding protein [Christensenella timonensis]|uniref:sugar ABC transporter substrate-binding protein n=1 Tax=Christensenella timonensis TaxID=1816678 RepID=UPI00082F43E1|nr:sugar ABC transporter substrate-binding protein [Christensenella timonensis]
MLKKVLCILLCMVMGVAVFSACTSETPEQGSAPASEAATASESTAQESSGGSEAAAAGETTDYGVLVGPAEGLTEDDYKFDGIFGGMTVFSDPMPLGAEQAAQELGIPTPGFFSPQNWDQNEQNSILDGLIAKGSTGLYLMPSNATAGNEQITKMADAGIVIVTVGGEPDTPTKSTLTLATDVYQQAYEGTKHIIEKLKADGVTEGKIVNLTGDISDPNTAKRIQGCEDACAENEGFSIVQSISDIDNSEDSMTAVENLLASSGKEINGIMCTAYYPAIAVAKQLTDEYSHIVAVGCDADESVVTAIQEGRMYGTMRQNPWGQGYLATITLKMLKDGWTFNNGEYQYINAGCYFLDSSNIDQEEQVCKDGTMELLATWTDRFTPPAA